MKNKDGSYGSRATQKELAEFYGLDAIECIHLAIHVAVPHRLAFCVELAVQQATIAAHHGRKSLKIK